MNFVMQITFFVLGSVVGSFLNVVVLRHNTGVSVRGRSSCPACGKKLGWIELVPVLSFLLQRGKCRSCLSGISWQYPLVEIVMGVLSLGVFLKFFDFSSLASSLFLVAYYLVIVSVLVAIVVYDIRHKIIPDSFVFLFIALSGAGLFVSLNPLGFSFPNIWHLLAGLLLFLPFFILWLASSGKWMGLGDAKLAWGIGWFLGPILGTSALILGFWAGAVFSLFLLIFQKLLRNYPLSIKRRRFTMKSEVPFAPFLVLGTFIAVFFDVNVLAWSFF